MPARVSSAPVPWHEFARDTFEFGREWLGAGGHGIGIYNAERSIVDAFRLRHLEGRDLALEALKRWLRRRGSHPADLLVMARRIDARSEVHPPDAGDPAVSISRPTRATVAGRAYLDLQKLARSTGRPTSELLQLHVLLKRATAFADPACSGRIAGSWWRPSEATWS